MTEKSVFEYAPIIGRNLSGDLLYEYYCEDADCPLRVAYNRTTKHWQIPVKHRGHTPLNKDGSIKHAGT